MATKNIIITEFNLAILAVNNGISSIRSMDLPAFQNSFNEAAVKLYHCAEWIMVHYVASVDPSREKKISDANFPDKIIEVKKLCGKELEDNKIELDTLQVHKGETRNKFEHVGFDIRYENVVRIIDTIRKLLLFLIDPDAKLTQLIDFSTLDSPTDSNWSHFFSLNNSFSKEEKFVLIIGPQPTAYPYNINAIGLVDWAIVIDFDINSEINGPLNACKKMYSDSRRISILTSDDPLNVSSSSTTYWLMAKGLEGRASTISNDFRTWNQKYSKYLQRSCEEIIKTNNNMPLNVLILWDDEYYIYELLKIFDTVGGNCVNFVMINPENKDLEFIRKSSINLSLIEISLSGVCSGLLNHASFFNFKYSDSRICLPSFDHETTEIAASDYSWVFEQFNIVHQGLVTSDLDTEDIEIVRRDFFRGQKVSWINLHLHHDIDRNITEQLKRKIEQRLRERNTDRFYLGHFPGSGGTTIGYRIAWDLYSDFPTLILKKYIANDSVHRVVKIFDITRKSVLVVVDCSVIDIDDIDHFYDEVKSKTFPCVILVIQRSDKSRTTPNFYYVPDILDDLEFKTFISLYKGLAVAKKETFDQILASQNKYQRHPFYLGLVAFDKDFLGLQEFISHRLTLASDIQKRILSMIALTYFYAQQSFSAQLLSTIIGSLEERLIDLHQILEYELMYLLIKTEANSYRPLHYLVAKEIIDQVFSGQETVVNRSRNLLPLGLQIINLIASKGSIPTENDMDLIRRLFVQRNNQDILGKEDDFFDDHRFSLFVQDLDSNEARLTVFLKLVENFPYEPHFWAHLARFYSFIMKNNEEALTCITKAIENSDGKDPLLFHMKGMVLRSLLYDLFTQYMDSEARRGEILLKVTTLIEECGAQFEECREIDPNDEHGYISHIQMLIKALDFHFSISTHKARIDFMRNLSPGLLEYLDLAEMLLSQLRLRITSSDHYYYNSCDSKINELYGDYSKVIEGWNNQLSKTNTNKNLIRRQIVNAYVRRSGSWDELPLKDAQKMLDLLEENLNLSIDSSNDIYLWFQTARQLENVQLHVAIERLSSWRSTSKSDDALYYLALLHVLQAINGNSYSKQVAENLTEELSKKMRNSPIRSYNIEWFGTGLGLKQLIPSKLAVINRAPTLQLRLELLATHNGKVSVIKGPEAGTIELDCGLKAFFIPARMKNYAYNQHLNENVVFNLGFSYDGLRAYNVILKSIVE